MASRRATFAICFGVIFPDMVSYGVISPSIPLFAPGALAASDAEMGLAFAGDPIAFTLCVLPLGLFVDPPAPTVMRNSARDADAGMTVAPPKERVAPDPGNA
jgi:hypothetical protein